MFIVSVRGLLATAAAVWCSATTALAAVDMNGAWFLRGYEPSNEYFFFCRVLVTQTGTSLTTQAVGCPYVGSLQGNGTIDVDTGVFSISAPLWAGFCANGFSLTGNVNATSTAFTATFNCQTAEMTFAGSLDGSRCGNGVLDAGEACDDGNQADHDCCSATCTFEASGAPCADGDPCTFDTCDGAGTCAHALQEGAPCGDDGNACTDDLCDASGACQHPPNAAPCDDGDVCTVNDVCSGGSCTAGSCSLCCDPLAGCVPAAGPGCKQAVSPNGLLAYSQLADKPNSLKWNVRNGEATSPAELGDPTTSTDYAVCIYRPIGATQDLDLVLAAEAAAGEMSGTKPSWTVRGSGSIRFRSRTGNADGLTQIAVRPGAGRTNIKVRGKGGALHLNPVYGGVPVIAQLRASNGTCFEARFSRRIRDGGMVFCDGCEPPFSLDYFSKDAPQ
jgi:cysteine-rich repeat protein